jgi:hypothetical protein
MSTTLTRAELAKLFPGNPKAVLAFDYQQQQLADVTTTLASSADATTALQDATVITLSPNATFSNERVLQIDGTLFGIDDGEKLTLGVLIPITLNGGYRLGINISADTYLDAPVSGVLLVDAGPFADDTAAASGGVDVGQVYRKSDGTMAWRVA